MIPRRTCSIRALSSGSCIVGTGKFFDSAVDGMQVLMVDAKGWEDIEHIPKGTQEELTRHKMLEQGRSQVARVAPFGLRRKLERQDDPLLSDIAKRAS